MHTYAHTDTQTELGKGKGKLDFILAASIADGMQQSFHIKDSSISSMICNKRHAMPLW